MKNFKIKLSLLSVIIMCFVVTSSSAKDDQESIYNAAPEVVSLITTQINGATLNYHVSRDIEMIGTVNLMFDYCYKKKRVWVWKGWFPKRVWKYVRVSCSQRGPGGTVPPY